MEVRASDGIRSTSYVLYSTVVLVGCTGRIPVVVSQPDQPMSHALSSQGRNTTFSCQGRNPRSTIDHNVDSDHVGLTVYRYVAEQIEPVPNDNSRPHQRSQLRDAK